MKKLVLISLIALIGGGLLVSSCNKQEAATPKAKIENAITKDAMVSNIPWKDYSWAAMHKAGTGPNGMAGDFKGLDAVDLINELCANDPELIPQNGRFKGIYYHKFTKQEIIDMTNTFFWTKRNFLLELPDDYNEYHPYSFWASYHPKIKEIVLAKLTEIQTLEGNPYLKVRSINFTQGDCYDVYGCEWSPKAGFAHGLLGFYYGDWMDH